MKFQKNFQHKHNNSYKDLILKLDKNKKENEKNWHILHWMCYTWNSKEHKKTKEEQ